MASILLDAHGTWDPSSVPAYAMVPKGSRLLFFTENMKLFVESLSDKAQLPSTEPNLIVESQKSAQNYTVSPFNSGGTLVGDIDYYVETGVNQRQDGLGDDGSAEVGTAISNDTVDKMISQLLPEPSDYSDLAPDQKQLLKDEILAGGTDDKTRMMTTRLVERLTERFG